MTTPGWHEWCLERVEEAREFAKINGLNLQIAMFWRLYANIDDLQDRFPDLPLHVALKEMAWHAAMADHEDQQRRPDGKQ